MVTQRELDDLTNEMMELTEEMRELKGMLLRRLSEAMVAVKTEQRAQERIEERITVQEIRIESLERIVTRLQPSALREPYTSHETPDLESPPSLDSSPPSETTSSPQ